ncbi:MAG: tRNA-modifying protein YgfZ [Alphaproteobacteria bacterium MarineAlpha5_Bin9]|nr:MAG: tRNA-modifying protein YgfZ [Alphaproteobacteria bacterium MarineAlpha5_Bin9]|tara:strand:- start:8836 stop:9699 length:864 start_codon:yes stop_codon:yes gene_type:complete
MLTGKYIILNDIKFLFIKGVDKYEFMQSIITNDINKTNNKVIYSCLLSPQGKFLSDFFISLNNEGFIIEINEIYLKDFIKKLDLYKLRSKVEIINNNDFKLLIILNSSINPNLEEGDFIDSNKTIHYVDPRNKKLGTRLIIKKNDIEKYIEKQNLIKTDENIYLQLMIENKIPNSIYDLEINKSLLLENNFENINAIDWNKGCYIGQEITARMKYRALIKKSLTTFDLTSGKINKGDNIFHNEKNVGIVKSVVNSKGLALIRKDSLEFSKNQNIYLNTKNGQIKIIN